MKLRIRSICSWMIALVMTAPLYAGTITDNLAEQMLQLEPGETISTLVMMAEQYPVHEQDLALHEARVALEERHEIVVTGLQALAESTQQPVRDFLTAREGSGAVADWHPFFVANMIAVRALPEVIRELAERDDVGDIYFDYPVENTAPIITPQKETGQNEGRPSGNGLTVVNADEVWYDLGITGEGALVCNIDTGVDGAHSALTDRWRGNTEPAAECFYDPVNNQNYPYDSGSHGTHTMGTITGMSTVTGDTVGVAFGADWIAAATIDHPGGGGIEGTIVLALQSFEWALDPDGDPGTMDDVPDVISNSWGIPHAYRPQCDETYWIAIDACEAAGSFVVFAAGNESYSGLRSPPARADSEYQTFAVAALNIDDPNNPYVASFSSRGPSLCTTDPVLMIKPEVAAPGENIYSSVPGGGYAGGWSGTSMACPHVAGLAALMRSANSGLDVITMKDIIMATVDDLGAGNNNDTGWGMIDCNAAVLQAMTGYGRVDGHVQSDMGDPLPALVTSDIGTQANADGTGYYMLALPGDESYTLTYSYFGYISDQEIAYVPIDDTTTVNVTLYPADSGTLEGYVYNPDGFPVDGAVVTAVGIPLPPVYTNPSGYYTMDLPGDAAYDFEAFGAGWGTQLVEGFFVPANTTTQLDFNLPLDPMYLPSGPDSYGYMIYDSNDAGGPLYSWDSISDVGTAVTLYDDDYAVIATGFNFDFYGSSFSQVSIGSNGYVTPGPSGFTTYWNQTIPNASDPNGSLYGYWDDLNPSSGGTVYYYYDTAWNRFIVEYNNVPFYGGGGSVTYQIVIQDPLYHPTITGDANWLIYYNSIDDRSSATIGIENGAGTDGIQYVYDGSYHENASPMENELALLVTTGQVSDGPHIAFDPVSIDLGEIYLGLPLVISYQICNVGLDPLEVTDIVGVSADGQLIPDQTVFTIDPVTCVPNSFTLIPEQPGEFSGILVHFNDSADNPEAEFNVSATVIHAPDIDVNPTSLLATLPPGETEDQILTISNLAAGELIFSVAIEEMEPDPPLLQLNPEVVSPSEQFQLDEGDIAATSSDGHWSPSDEEPDHGRPEDILVVATTTVDGSVLQVLNDLGLVYDYVNTTDWNDALFAGYPTIIIAMDGGTIEETGVLALADAANAGAQVISIGGTNWTPYYNGMQNYIIGHTGEEGWTQSSTPHLQVTDPGHPLAEDLPAEYTFANSAASYYMLRANDPDISTAAINGDGWPDLFARPMGSGSYSAFLNSAYSTYWSDAGDYAILSTVMSNMLNYAATTWISVTPTSGTVAPWADVELTVTFDATDMEEGTYEADINISSNDPDEPLVTVPATLIVGYGCETHDIVIEDVNWSGGTLYLSINGGEVGNEYDIYRSIDPYSFPAEPYVTVPVTSTPQLWADAAGGPDYFYRVVETCDLVPVAAATTSPYFREKSIIR